MYRSFLILISFLSIECQVCTKRVVNDRWVYQSYRKTFIDTYTAHCWYGKCSRTKIGTTFDMKLVKKEFLDTKKFCCDGYILQDVYDYEENDNIQCNPICAPSCENGYCDKPGKCECNSGYFLESHNSHRCLPSCKIDCGHGHCEAPDICKCDFGYTLQNDTCKPVCNEPCINGTCIGPDTCECRIGYRKSENNTCPPYCSKGCTNGSCISPEFCQCDDGFKKSDDVCIAHCEHGCVNGNCTAPGECTCYTGYKMQNETCVPHCNIPCLNGNCIAPDTCECNEGWANNSIGLCDPICSIPCRNGTCVAPDQCQCDYGYVNSERGYCIPQCEKCDHGNCTAPGRCECDQKVCVVRECEFCCGTCAGINGCDYAPRDIIFDSTCSNYSEYDWINTIETTDGSTSTENSFVRDNGTATTGNSFVRDDADEMYNVTKLFYLSTYSDQDITTDSNTYAIESKDLRKNVEFSEYPLYFYFLLLGIILVSSASACILVFVNRRKIQYYFKGGSYAIEDRHSLCKDLTLSQTLVNSITSNLSYSDLNKRRENNPM